MVKVCHLFDLLMWLALHPSHDLRNFLKKSNGCVLYDSQRPQSRFQ